MATWSAGQARSSTWWRNRRARRSCMLKRQLIQEVMWLRGLLVELGLTVAAPSMVYGDNQSTVTVSEQGVRSERTKHVDVKYHFITEQIELGVIKVKWVPTEQQLADVLT